MLNSLDSDGTWGTFHGRGVSRYRAGKIYPGHHPERDHSTDSFLLLKKKAPNSPCMTITLLFDKTDKFVRHSNCKIS